MSDRWRYLLWVALGVIVGAIIIGGVISYGNSCHDRGGQVITGHQGMLYCVPRVP